MTKTPVQPQIIQNVPYLSRLEGGGLQPGQTVFVKGIKQGDNFSVSFLTSQNHENGDAALTLAAHGKDKQILLNDRSSGKQGKDEKVKFAVKDGEHVDLRFRAHDNKFTVRKCGFLVYVLMFFLFITEFSH